MNCNIQNDNDSSVSPETVKAEAKSKYVIGGQKGRTNDLKDGIGWSLASSFASGKASKFEV
jgi:hypothetical protein